MKELSKIPKGFTAKATNGEAILYVSDEDQDIAVLVSKAGEVITELPTQSALARGYWKEIKPTKD